VAYVISSATDPGQGAISGALWKTDGTQAGTVRVRDFSGATVYSAPMFLTAIAGKAVFSDGSFLWRSDGTTTGTVQIDRVFDPATPDTLRVFGGPAFAVVQDRIFFSAAVPGGGRELRIATLTAPPAPTELSISSGASLLAGNEVAGTTQTVQLTWVDASTTETGFVIERSRLSDFSVLDHTFFVPANSTRFVDTTAAAGVTYFYRVRATNAGGLSTPSNIVAPSLPVGLLPSIDAVFDFSGPAGGKTLNISAGTITLTSDLGAANANIAIHLTGGKLIVNATQHLAALSLTGGAVAAAIHAQNVHPFTLVVGQLSIDGASKLDLADNSLILHAQSLLEVQPLLARGYNGGDWLGGGITSSTAAADSAGITALGSAVAGDLGLTTFGGEAVSATDVLVKYTYYGDADLSGSVTGDDESLLLFGLRQGGAPHWSFGDFDYSGHVNGDDYSLFLAGLRKQPIL
jgi:ELWxxDGT repeat protein